MKNLSIKSKLLAIVISSIVIVSVIIMIQSYIALYKTSDSITQKVKKESYDAKEKELKSYDQIVLKIVENYYKLSLNDPQNTQMYKEKALKIISNIRYGKDGYFWINNSEPKMIMHAIKPSLNGKNLSKIKDPNGLYLFNEMVKATSQNKEGLVKYFWPKPGFDKPQPKFSYVIKFEPWDWIIGSGDYVDNIETVITKMEHVTHEEIYNVMVKKIITIIIVMIVLASIMLFISKRSIFDPLNSFQNGLLNFFKYLNKEQEDVKYLDDTSKDEIGIMAKEVNKNIKKTKSLIEQDHLLIEDVKRVVEEVKAGYLDKKIEKSTENESLNELQIIFNEMIEIMEKNVHNNINELNDVLHSFKNRDFRTSIKSPKGEVSKTLNELSEIINKMLLDNLSIGSTMNQNAHTLKGNVHQLSISSNEQAASLEETAAALEEITSTITQTSENINVMSNYSNELSSSIKSGQDLANETTSSMDKINEQTNLIADAITIIDQIAFQTNILSLNAAVEAATAGEAGKGFAVVAQEVRNLASRSAEAAKEIKDIVETATLRANNGKEISSKMIEGYNEIHRKVEQTNQIIENIKSASKEQTIGITQINNAVAQLDKSTQENANIANNTSEIANQTSEIAIKVVEDTKKSEFIGKETIKFEVKEKEMITKNTSIEKTKPIEIKKEDLKMTRTVKASKDDDEWENF